MENKPRGLTAFICALLLVPLCQCQQVGNSRQIGNARQTGNAQGPQSAELQVRSASSVEEAQLALGALLDDLEPRFSKVIDGASSTSGSPLLRGLPSVKGKPTPYDLSSELRPNYMVLASRLEGLDLGGLATFVRHVQSQVDPLFGERNLRCCGAEAHLLRVGQASPRDASVARRTLSMLATLRQVQSDLSISPHITSTPQAGATVLIQSALQIRRSPQGHECLTTTEGGCVNVYRGLYTYTLSVQGTVKKIGSLDLIDKPGTTITCTLSFSGGESFCEAQ